jgi:cytochrome b561
MSTTRYSGPRRALHWTIAATFLGAVGSGIAFGNGADTAFVPHVLLGSATGLLAVARLVLWAVKPGETPPRSNAAARVVHWALALGPVPQLISGIVMLVLADALARIAAGLPPERTVLSELPPAAPHGAIGFALGALALGHIALALWHHYGKGDRLIARMGRG